MNWIIGTVLVVGLPCALLAILACMAKRVNTKREEQIKQHFSHEPMDLRLPEEPCDRCIRWGECNGVDKDNCPLCKAEKDLWQCENT